MIAETVREISRIRIDAFGPTASAVEASLLGAAKAMYADPFLGEQVIERVIEEPGDSRYAFKGRLVLHPNTAAILTSNTLNVSFTGTSGTQLVSG